MPNFDYKSDSKRALRLHDKYYDLASAYMNDFIDKLISVSVFSLGFVSLLIHDEDIFNNGYLRFSFILGVLSFILVILLGVFLKHSLNGFLNKVGDSFYERHIKIEQHIYNTGKSLGDAPISSTISLGKTPEEYAPWWHKLQMALFILGVMNFSGLLLSFTF